MLFNTSFMGIAIQFLTLLKLAEHKIYDKCVRIMSFTEIIFAKHLMNLYEFFPLIITIFFFFKIRCFYDNY